MLKRITGIGDEASDLLDRQLEAARELNWTQLELRQVEVPGSPKQWVHDLESSAFDVVIRRLEASGVRLGCLGTSVLKTGGPMDAWGPRLEQLERALERAGRLGCRLIRIMSFEPGPEEYRIPAEVFRRIKEVVQRCEDAGVQAVHENCRNYGGMSWKHALELVDKCPGLKWAYDTGNPLGTADRSKSKPWPLQNPWEFWENIRDHVVHIHVKDGCWEETQVRYTWPGEGKADLVRVLRDAHTRGYSGLLSIEPAMVRVPRPGANPADPQDLDLLARQKFSKFIDYARCLEVLVREVP